MRENCTSGTVRGVPGNRHSYRRGVKEKSSRLSTRVIQWIIFFPMHTVVELPEYLRRAERLLSERARTDLVAYLAAHPKAGVIMQGTGGIRKLRWAREGRGKRGGVRVIYYYHDAHLPLYLLTIFGKGEKDNLTKAEQHALQRLVCTLLATRRTSHGSRL